MDCCHHGQENTDMHDHDAPAGAVSYTCPMHPRVLRDKPGMCPECGMSLVPVKLSAGGHDGHGGHAGFDKHAGHHADDFLRTFWIAVALAVPIILYSDLPRIFFGWSAPGFPGSAFLSLVLGSIVFFYCGAIFLTSAYRELRARLPGMMTLIAIAISVAYVYSVYQTFAGATHTLWWELSTLVAIMLLGHSIEMRAVKGAQGALRELSKLLPDTAERVTDGGTETVAVSALHDGNLVLVRPGTAVPADGTVTDGSSEVNESILTGESKPVAKAVGAAVIAGSVNGDGSLTVRVMGTGEHTFLSGVMRLVADAQASKSRLQTLADRAAGWLTFAAISAGAVTVVAWLAVGASVSTAVERLVAVLVIACPHALGLAVPLVSSISTTMGARSGLLVRKRLALEAARRIDVVLFDKTGTLTTGAFAVTAASSDEALALAAAVNARSEHPIAAAIVDEAKRRSLPLAAVSDFRRVPGRGAEGTVSGARVFVGTKGGDDIVVEQDGARVGTIAVADAPRPESAEAVRRLRALGVKTAMITGDSEEVTARVARELGIDEYFARVLPEGKAGTVKDLQGRGRKVAMVGDGVNDAPALAQADVGIAIGAGTNVAIESAGIILVRNDPRDIAKVIRLSELTHRKMVQNLWWAAGYNIIAIPLAAGALAAYGILLQPAVAAIFMSASTVIVSINAVLMRRARLS